MAAIVKTKLKNAREAIGKKNYELARDMATDVLGCEPDNYHANVFLGLACLELGESERSEQAYRKAIEQSPDQILAWQGITKLYERKEDWEQYADALLQTAQLFTKANDAVKCAETLQKFIDLRRSNGTPQQICSALSLLLPDSTYYPLLSSLPPPDPTNPTSTTTFPTQMAIQNTLPILEEIVLLSEKEEENTIKNEVARRRTRLSAAGPEQIKREVNREVMSSSQLPKFYNEIMNHPNASDDLRRLTESKFLRHKQQLLQALPSSSEFATQKAQLSAELRELVDGMVLLQIPDEIAWSIYIEGKDAAVIEDYDLDIFRKYIKLFPTTSLRNLFYAYLRYYDLPVSEDEESESGHDDHHEGESVDYAEAILDAFQGLPHSIVAHRIVGELYEQDYDYENTIKISEAGLELAERAEKSSHIKLSAAKKAFNVVLANALVHLFPPKHHPRAIRILDDVLAEDPDNVRCLMGRAYTLQHANKWAEAKAQFDKVVALLPEDLGDGIQAQEESAWCTMKLHDPETAAKSLRAVIDVLDELEDRGSDQARSWYRLGQCLWSTGDSGREEAYQHFVTSLKRSSTFAPAFTSLGIYYLEFASPPDPKRASKCFQKAFELDPREGDAARRLAEGFAEDREWDLVEVIAQRTIEGEGGVESGEDAAATAALARHLPVNSWAWKALGVVEMNRQNYPPAIRAFQIVLRTDPEDQLTWLRLGEAYSKAGRHEAAIKTLKRAQELDPESWIASYFLGDVERQTGQFQVAINIFTEILSKHPAEAKVLSSLAQTYYDLGRTELVSFFVARAEASFVVSIKTVLRLMDASPGHRRIGWKIAADAFYYLSGLSSISDVEDIVSTTHQVLQLLPEPSGERLKDIVPFPLRLDTSSDTSLSFSILEMTIVVYHYRASLGALDNPASGSAHYDIGIALFSYARRSGQAAKVNRAREESVTYFKEALGFDPTNERYWNALGTAVFQTQPRVAQHAYIKALDLDPRNAAMWTNLGLFYLYHEDLDLATEAFYKAQIFDPDYTLAWVGRGLVSAAQGNETESRAFFEHSISLPTTSPEADISFATKLFTHLRTIRDLTSLDAIYPAFFVLSRYCKQRSQDAYALHLFGLVCEAIGHYGLGIEVIEKAITILEAAYEESEDSALERQFTIAHINLSRLRLSDGDYEGTLSSCQFALGPLQEEVDNSGSDSDPSTRSLLAQAQLCSGLAHFRQGQLEEALKFFESAVENSGDNQAIRNHAVVSLAQTLWAIGTEDGRESAKNQLLQGVEVDPENLLAINALAGMGILTDDESLVDAALSEILSLTMQERQERDPEGEVTYLLTQQHLAQGEFTQAMSVVQKAIIAQPSLPKNKLQLARLALQSGNIAIARAVLASVFAVSDLTRTRDALPLEALVERKSGDPERKSLKLAQKAVMLAPWKEFNWQALEYLRASD